MDQMLSLNCLLLWKKYRPVILKLMVDATNGPQRYQLLKHEVNSVTAKGKSANFTLQVHNNKALSGLKDSPHAAALLETLISSKRATELLQTATYEFVLNRDYSLQVTRVETL